MKKEKIIHLLKMHYVPYKIENGEIYADSMESGTETFENVVNVTNWTKSDLLEWLGY